MRALRLYDSVADASVTTALRFVDTVDGTNKFHTVLHTGNKPSGSYTGNGDATARTIDTGGIGNACLVRQYAYAVTLVTVAGAITFRPSDAQIIYHKPSEMKFENGILTIATANASVNANGSTHVYYVL